MDRSAWPQTNTRTVNEASLHLAPLQGADTVHFPFRGLSLSDYRREQPNRDEG